MSNGIATTAKRPSGFGNLYMTPKEVQEYANDVAGEAPYYTLTTTGPKQYQFKAQPNSDTEAYDMNLRAMKANAVPEEVAKYIWMRKTPKGMIYSVADKLYEGSDFTDVDLSAREGKLRKMGWMPVIDE